MRWLCVVMWVYVYGELFFACVVGIRCARRSDRIVVWIFWFWFFWRIIFIVWVIFDNDRFVCYEMKFVISLFDCLLWFVYRFEIWYDILVIYSSFLKFLGWWLWCGWCVEVLLMCWLWDLDDDLCGDLFLEVWLRWMWLWAVIMSCAS